MPQNFEGYVTNCAPHKALKSIARGKLTFDERILLTVGMAAKMGLICNKCALLFWRSSPGRSSSSPLFLSSLELSDTTVYEP